MHKVKCVKCQTAYDSPEPDDYYCPSCLEETKKIAAEVDAKFKNRPTKRPTQSDWQALEENGRLNMPGGHITIRGKWGARYR